VQNNFEVEEMPVQKLYELSEAAPLIGVTLGTLRQWVATGVIPALHIGRKRVIREDVLERICTVGLEHTKKEKPPA
jgi:excisionase family DNA binding protein